MSEIIILSEVKTAFIGSRGAVVPQSALKGDKSDVCWLWCSWNNHCD